MYFAEEGSAEKRDAREGTVRGCTTLGRPVIAGVDRKTGGVQRTPSEMQGQWHKPFPARNPICDLFTVGEVWLWSFSPCVCCRDPGDCLSPRACVVWPHWFLERFSG